MNIIYSRLKKINNSTIPQKKWISNDQMNHKLSNLLWKAQQTTDPKPHKYSNSDLPNTWETIQTFYFGPKVPQPCPTLIVH